MTKNTNFSPTESAKLYQAVFQASEYKEGNTGEVLGFFHVEKCIAALRGYPKPFDDGEALLQKSIPLYPLQAKELISNLKAQGYRQLCRVEKEMIILASPLMGKKRA